MSSYEDKIIQILKKHKVPFVREKTFADLKLGSFRYDFYLPREKILIECDGIQHFQQIKHFHKTRQDFLKAQERDRRKNNYALAHQIPLYRIPYWEINNLENLEQIFNYEHLVKSMYHNDNLKPPKSC
jgi:very-short-patch-repair endonuclease